MNTIPWLTSEPPKRLAPTAETLRELYLLSGNRCAMPGCRHLLIDGNGVVVGHICHIRGALPDGPRFDATMSNEARRQAPNLLMLCAGHHKQIDSPQYQSRYAPPALEKVKADHEAKFRGLADSLQAAFEQEYVDITDRLIATEAFTFARFEQLLTDCRLEPGEREERRRQISAFIARMSVVPPDVRSAMLAIIRRAQKLGCRDGALVSAEDLKSSLRFSNTGLNKLGQALARYGVGNLDLHSRGMVEEYCVWIGDPAETVTWYDLRRFCDAARLTLDEFVRHLRFACLDE